MIGLPYGEKKTMTIL